jgi:CubicO group peptidase (beta-lactamase class C family)
MTKIVTCVAIMQLYEKGLLLLTDPLDTYIPAFENMQVYMDELAKSSDNPSTVSETLAAQEATTGKLVPAKTRITLHHLLTHTSGFMYSEGLSSSAGVNAFYLKHRVQFNHELSRTDSPLASDFGAVSLETMCNRLAECPLVHEPGTSWTYGFNMDVLGRVVEVVSGQPLREYFQQHIFTPLHMQDTDFMVTTEEQKARFASAFVAPAHPWAAEYKDGVVWDGVDAKTSPFLRSNKLTLPSGGGGLVSTVADYMKFGNSLATLDGVILAPKTVQYMMQNHLPNHTDLHEFGAPNWCNLNRKGQGFGLGGHVIIDPVAFQSNVSLGEYGWNGAINTVFWVDPIEKVSVVFMTQLFDVNKSYRRTLRGLVNSLIINRPTSS